MLDFFVDRLWPGIAAWTVLYISDYAMTIWCASLYQKHVRQTITFEGSYELTPVYQRDVDALRRVSPRFVVALGSSVAVLALLWVFVRASLPLLYAFVLGALLLLEVTVHVRHVRNLSMFRDIAKGGSIHGRIEYSRPMVLRMSAVELVAFSGMYFVIFLFTQSWFVLGGAAACVSTARKHFMLARKSAASAHRAVPAHPAYPAVLIHF
jgi:hypothetical protein